VKVQFLLFALCAQLLFIVSFAHAEPKKIPKIGFLGALSPSAVPARVSAFRQGLSSHGYIEGKTILVEYRWAEGKFDLVPALAAELVHLNVDGYRHLWPN